MNKGQTSIQYFDTLRAIATMAVIVIHISSPLLNMTWTKDMHLWWIGNVVDSSVRFAVPLFLMLSGATMLGKNYQVLDFYKRRFMRVLLPFLFWLLIYAVYRWVMLKPLSRPEGFHDIVQWATTLFLTEGISKHFWYIYMIVFIYLALPLLAALLRNINQQVLFLLVVCWVVMAFFSKSIAFNAYNWTGDYGSKFLGYATHGGYLLLGYFLAKTAVFNSQKRLISLLVFFATIAISSLVAYFMSIKTGKLNLSIYSYLSINTIIQSAAVFLIFRDFTVSNKFLNRIQSTISNYSYGIYLVHIIVIGVLFRNGIYWSFAHPIISLPVLTILVLILSATIIFIIRLIPGGKFISG